MTPRARTKEHNVTLHPSITDLEMPRRVAALPRTGRGFPVPWFVAWVDGEPDFRVIAPGRVREAVERNRCWICGGFLAGTRAYVVGPMCAVNRVSAEPPSHHDCAVYAARACPFLARPHARRRENAMPEGAVDAPGIALKRIGRMQHVMDNLLPPTEVAA